MDRIAIGSQSARRHFRRRRAENGGPVQGRAPPRTTQSPGCARTFAGQGLEYVGFVPTPPPVETLRSSSGRRSHHEHGPTAVFDDRVSHRAEERLRNVSATVATEADE